LMLVTAIFCLAYTQRLGRHLRIDLMDRYLQKGVRGIVRDIVATAMGLFFSVILLWQTWTQAWWSLQSGEVTTGILAIPAFPMRIAISVSVGLLCLVLIAQILRNLASLIRGRGMKK
jgi:TRAP-type mannitol/chloroaromatic compound transport system permease small subunit